MKPFSLVMFYCCVILIEGCAKVSTSSLPLPPHGEGVQGIAAVQWGDAEMSQALRMAVKVIPPNFFRFEVLDQFSGSIGKGSCDGETCIVCEARGDAQCRQKPARKVIQQLFGVDIDPSTLIRAFAGQSSESIPITLSDYRHIEKKRFPFVISILFPDEGKFLDIHYQEVERIK